MFIIYWLIGIILYVFHVRSIARDVRKDKLEIERNYSNFLIESKLQELRNTYRARLWVGFLATLVWPAVLLIGVFRRILSYINYKLDRYAGLYEEPEKETYASEDQ